ncbi:hypothetical protein GCM10009835_52410 [Planosporangium flavigriseum]|uniref:Uncharacterized protein n=1 Tax=Planosporangium flavigriseum TaxID=373681 RepID=A0A8J3LSF6_9ACTN|nr:hypothetical protein Pfl04_41820 [Planosporangium flavigriseum]
MTVEDVAVPRWNFIDEFMEALGHAAADAGPHVPPPPRPARDWRALHPPPPPPEPPRPRGFIYIYPRIGEPPPWGCAACSPMGEGSEDTAVPAIDPAEARLHPEQLDVAPGEPDLREVQRERRPRPA